MKKEILYVVILVLACATVYLYAYGQSYRLNNELIKTTLTLQTQVQELSKAILYVAQEDTTARTLFLQMGAINAK